MTTMKELAAEVDALRTEVRELSQRLDGVRVIRPKVGVRVEDCALGNDPATCPSASTRQYQKGCHGQACFDVNGAYYAQQRDRAKAKKVAATKVAAPKKRVTKASAAPTAKPAAVRRTKTKSK